MHPPVPPGKIRNKEKKKGGGAGGRFPSPLPPLFAYLVALLGWLAHLWCQVLQRITRP